MSTTFGIVVDELYEIEIAKRVNKSIRWINPIAKLLPDSQKVIPLDNTSQGIKTIGDIKKYINKNK